MRYITTILALLISCHVMAQQNSLWYQANQPIVDTSKPYIVPDADSTNIIDTLLAHSETPTANDKAYLGQLIHELKGQRCPGVTYIDTPVNIWDSLVAFYPMMLKSAFAHSLDIRNITSTTRRLVHVGSPTHDSLGITYNGLNQWSVTGIYPLQNGLLTNNTSMGVYVSKGALTGSGCCPTIMGCFDSTGVAVQNHSFEFTVRPSTNSLGGSVGGELCNSFVTTKTGLATPFYGLFNCTSTYNAILYNGAWVYRTNHGTSYGGNGCYSTACSPVSLGADISCVNASGGSSNASTTCVMTASTFFLGHAIGSKALKWAYDCMYNYNHVNYNR